MKKALLPIALIGVIALIVASCHKFKTTVTGTAVPLNQLFYDLHPAAQGLSVTAGRDTMVMGAKGTLLHFYPNSFKDAHGNIITSGTVYLQLIEMYKIGDMVTNRTITVTADGRTIKSRGQVNITATMNGSQVYANKYGIGFPQDNSSTQKMQLYYGNAGNADSLSEWNVCDTTQPGTVAWATVTTVIDSSTNSFFTTTYSYIIPPKPWYYVFDSCTSFNFINCDHWWNTSASELTNASLTISDPSKFTSDNTQIFVSLPDELINVSMSKWHNDNTDTFSTREGLKLGMNYKLVAMSKINGQYYIYQQSGVVTSNMVFPAIVMTPDTKEDIIARLSGL